jgi:hypothetical protein
MRDYLFYLTTIQDLGLGPPWPGLPSSIKNIFFQLSKIISKKTIKFARKMNN